MELPRSVIDAYNRAIKQCGDGAEAATRKALDAWLSSHPGAPIEQINDVCRAIMAEFGGTYGMAAGDAAHAMRSIAAEAAGVEVAPDTYEYAPDPDVIDATARYQVGKLLDGDRAGFVGAIADASRYFAERGANDTMAHFAEVDRDARFARVPTGATTCTFCLMLASRGFVYRSEAKALNANHRHCDCRIVEGFGGMAVEGYDPEYYLDCYEHPEDHPEIRDAINARRRERYAKRRESSASVGARNAAFSAFDGSFGEATASLRDVYAGTSTKSFADGMVDIFNSRYRAKLEVEGNLEQIGKDNLAAVLSGIEYGGRFVGTDPSSVKLVSTQRLARGALAQAERRGNDVVLRLNANRLRGLSQDQVEQIVFHEMAHTPEYRLVTDAQFIRETERLIRFQQGDLKELPASTASKRLEKVLQEAGIQARYVPGSGKIEITGADANILYELPDYAWDGADKGTQDSELIAESIRFVATNGYGNNSIADIVARAFIRK